MHIPTNHANRKSETHQWGCFASHMPGSEMTLWFKTRSEAIESARDANRKPWNRSSNRALVINPSGKGTRNY